MTPTTSSASEQAWAMIDQEKRRDRFVRRVNIAAWTVTFLVVVFLGVISIWQMIELMRSPLFGAGDLFPVSAFFGALYPLLIVLGALSVLIATLSTIGIFLRLRTASLIEIQLRLASLEELLAKRE
jgi:peptidoglycan biosynthesis protein MviN/MurJ (putative lipid II flippase)